MNDYEMGKKVTGCLFRGELSAGQQTLGARLITPGSVPLTACDWTTLRLRPLPELVVMHVLLTHRDGVIFTSQRYCGVSHAGKKIPTVTFYWPNKFCIYWQFHCLIPDCLFFRFFFFNLDVNILLVSSLMKEFCEISGTSPVWVTQLVGASTHPPRGFRFN